MTYQPLARKYRPQTFTDLVGQGSVATALANSIKLQREIHAVIFSGVRGVGKTTIARLYAKALNCIHGPTDNPCGVCESCLAIEIGNHEDVLEIDGASHTSVDDIRRLRDTVAYVAQRSKFKVYIIDEVHMLSQSAFNALLKTLEEPPAHVVFIFATTELQKIPQTIASRCQIFFLKKFAQDTMISRIQHVLNSEQISYDELALQWVARQARGSMRDALTCLDQVIAFGNGSVTMDGLKDLIGVVPQGVYLDLIDAMLARDQNVIYKIVAELTNTQLPIVNHVEELATFCRNAFIYKSLKQSASETAQLDLDEYVLKRLALLTETAAALDLNRLFRILIKCRADLDGSGMDRYIFENYLSEWCQDPGLPSVDEIRSWLQQKKPMTPAPAAPHRPEKLAGATIQANTSQVPPQSTDVAPPKVMVATGGFPLTWRELVDQWKQVKPLQARILEDVYAEEYHAKKICLAVNPESLAAGKLLQIAVQQKLRESFLELFKFSGILEIKIRRPEDSNQTGGDQAQPQENILSIKAREKDQAQQTLIQQAREHPMTQTIQKTFNIDSNQIKIETDNGL